MCVHAGTKAYLKSGYEIFLDAHTSHTPIAAYTRPLGYTSGSARGEIYGARGDLNFCAI